MAPSPVPLLCVRCSHGWFDVTLQAQPAGALTFIAVENGMSYGTYATVGSHRNVQPLLCCTLMMLCATCTAEVRLTEPVASGTRMLNVPMPLCAPVGATVRNVLRMAGNGVHEQCVDVTTSTGKLPPAARTLYDSGFTP